MGMHDTFSNQFLAYNDIYADLFNAVLFAGRQRINPAELRPVDPVLKGCVERLDAQYQTIERRNDLCRDWICRADDGGVYCLRLCTEVQARPDASMPIRMMMYTAMHYERLYREWAARQREAGQSRPCLARLPPCYSIVLHLSTEAWNAPLRLHDLLLFPDDRLREEIQDFSYKVVSPSTLTDEVLGCFKTDLRNFMETLRNGYMGWRSLSENIRNLEAVFKVRPEGQNLLTEILGPCPNLHNKEKKNMWSGWQESLDDTRAEGKAEGMAEGMTKGKAEGKAEGMAEGMAEGTRQEFARLMNVQISYLRSQNQSDEAIVSHLKLFNSIPEEQARRLVKESC